MRKMALIMSLILLVSFVTPAYASANEEISPFVLNIFPSISFDGTTAKCSAIIIGDNMSDSISATLKLWQGNSCIATWYASGNGYMQVSKSKSVTRGITYKLTVDVTINGTLKPTVSVLGTC